LIFSIIVKNIRLAEDSNTPRFVQ